jgi:adenylyltransferase/sulfurtransferase
MSAPYDPRAPESMARYARQLILPEGGLRLQQRLAESRVLLVGAGGLGSPLLLYLAAAGVGHLDIVDHDVVELSNLHRQIALRHDAIGQPKAEVAAATARALNPDVRIVPHVLRLDANNLPGLLAGADLVIDGSDNFATRYAVADAARAAGVPLLTASLFRWEGQLTLLPHRGGEGPCLRCLYPAPPRPGTVATCAEAGILGTVAGVLATTAANEAIKHLAAIGPTLAGRLLIYDGLASTWEEIRVGRRTGCQCGGSS